jgi:hypothetical protein
VGFFDFRCPISGLSLRAARAVHVALVEVTPGRWSPLSLPLVGCYDRGGSVDGFVPDFRTELFVSGFARMARAGRADAEGEPDEFARFSRAPGIDQLLRLFERVNTMSQWGDVPFTLDGCPLRQVLIHAGVFAALAPAARPTRAPEYEQLEAQLAAAPVAPQARELFEAVIIAPDEVRIAASVALAQLAAFTRWLEASGRQWSPASESGQFFASEDLEFAREARTRLAAIPELLPVIDGVIAELEAECARYPD